MLADHFWVLIPDLLMVMMFEFLVDWVKHAFITKFNDIPAEVSVIQLVCYFVHPIILRMFYAVHDRMQCAVHDHMQYASNANHSWCVENRTMKG